MPFATAGALIAEKRQPVVSVSPGATALAALGEIEQKDIAFLPVLEGRKLVGVVPERDIADAHASPMRRVVLPCAPCREGRE